MRRSANRRTTDYDIIMYVIVDISVLFHTGKSTVYGLVVYGILVFPISKERLLCKQKVQRFTIFCVHKFLNTSFVLYCVIKFISNKYIP